MFLQNAEVFEQDLRAEQDEDPAAGSKPAVKARDKIFDDIGDGIGRRQTLPCA